MGATRFPSIVKQMLKGKSFVSRNQVGEVPRGHVAVYVGELQDKTRFVVPILYLNHPTFKCMLKRAEEEYGFNHPRGGLTIPCKEDAFINFLSSARLLNSILMRTKIS